MAACRSTRRTPGSHIRFDRRCAERTILPIFKDPSASRPVSRYNAEGPCMRCEAAYRGPSSSRLLTMARTIIGCRIEDTVSRKGVNDDLGKIGLSFPKLTRKSETSSYTICPFAYIVVCHYPPSTRPTLAPTTPRLVRAFALLYVQDASDSPINMSSTTLWYCSSTWS